MMFQGILVRFYPDQNGTNISMPQKHNPFIYTCKDKSELNSLDRPEDYMLTEIKCDP